MYLPKHFDEQRPEWLHPLMAAHPLALVITPGADGLTTADTLPLMLATGDNSPDSSHGTLHGHVARANPLWRLADGQEVLVVFQGPQGYVSPNWYPSKAEHGQVVPTWNYAMVQARGRLRALDDAAAARRLVQALTETHEARQPRPWQVDDAPADYVAATLRAIVVIEIPITQLQGKFKLSQNRSAADQAGVLQGLSATGRADDGALAASMVALAAAKPPTR